MVKKQIIVSISCVGPVIDHEFRHNIVKVAVDDIALWIHRLLRPCYDEVHDQ